MDRGWEISFFQIEMSRYYGAVFKKFNICAIYHKLFFPKYIEETASFEDFARFEWMVLQQSKICTCSHDCKQKFLVTQKCFDAIMAEPELKKVWPYVSVFEKMKD